MLDISKPENLVIENVAELIQSKDDTENRQLRVDFGGMAYLSDDVGNENLKNVKFRFETFCYGNGYCGQNAASDKEWVERIHGALKENWNSGTNGYVEFF